MDVEPSASRQAVAPGKFSNGRYLWPGQKVPLEDGSYDIPLKEGFREAPQPKIPSSVLSHIRQETPLFSSGSPTCIEQDQKTTRIRRPYMTISHLRTPQYSHFNSQGEAILPQHFPVNNGINRPEPSRLCPSCFSTNLSTVGGHCANCRSTATFNLDPSNGAPRILGMDSPSLSKVSRVASARNNIPPRVLDVQKMDVDSQRNMGPGNLEFSYPDLSAIKPTVGRNLHNSHNRDKTPGRQNTLPHIPHILIRPPRGPPPFTNNVQSPNIEPGPTKRQKLSHPPTVKANASQPVDTPTGPNTDKSSINIGRSLKLCSSSNCTGTISASSGTRCLPCVRRDWKSRRESVAAKPPIPVSQMRSSKEQNDHGGVAGKSQKKSVTWAEGKVQCLLSPTPPNELPPRGGLKFGDIIAPPDISVNDDNVNHNERNRKLENDVLTTDQPGIDMECSPSLSSSKEDPQEGHISGWDSDLTELSESPEPDENFGSPSKVEMKSSSGLKIRIPARPAGVYSKKCASQNCGQMLKFGYQWKLCLMCRAQRREVDRKKRPCSSVHQGPLEVLTDDGNMGTPLSMDLQKHIHQVKLVQGARLCAIKSCTYVIPPIDEYNGRKCTLCLLRGSERRHLEKETDQYHSPRTKLVSQPSFWLQQLDHDRTDKTDESGRCCRYGCGMFLSDSSPSRECKQCVGRRQWLTNKFTGQSVIPDGPAILHRGSRKPLHRPRGLAPYPKYKCFSSALKEFKDRLAGFLRVQTIFFLINQPLSSDAFFAFDAEYSIVALDFELSKRREEVAANILKLKTTIGYVGRIKFDPKRVVSILEGGGVSIRFSCMYPVPMLQSRTKDGETIINSFLKFMQCELEIAVVPDYSHCFVPGQRTVIRFRLFG